MELMELERENMCLIGASSMDDWVSYQKTSNSKEELQVVLLTHPRDETDLPRLLPWSEHLTMQDRRALTRILMPVFGEIIKTPTLNAGILFLPMYADEMINPRTRAHCRKVLEETALEIAARAGAKMICLGGLTGALSLYGRRLLVKANELGLQITTGHSMTAVSVLRTYLRALDDLRIDHARATMTVIGVGSIGGSFTQLLARQRRRPARIVLVDTPSRADHVRRYAEQLQADCGIGVEVEFTSPAGALPIDSAAYRSRFVISAVSTANIIDIDRVAPGTVLIDDSQPYCWSRQSAWARVHARQDIAPCEAGLIDCSSIGYRSRFSFDFADQDETGESSTSWSCMAEGLLRVVAPDLPPTIGEPCIDNLLAYDEAFGKCGLKVPALQCGNHKLPIDEIRKHFSA
ncbi:hypothetical protein [Massilia violaceinigra]|nr:hypothetical protein [Massilia violaceinigra]